MYCLSREEMTRVHAGADVKHTLCVLLMGTCGVIGDVVLGAASLGVGAAVWTLGWGLFSDKVCEDVHDKEK